jgi:hypothetical protein
MAQRDLEPGKPDELRLLDYDYYCAPLLRFCMAKNCTKQSSMVSICIVHSSNGICYITLHRVEQTLR